MIFDRIKAVIVEQLDVSEEVEITEETSMMKDLDADSLDAVEIMMELEDEFEIEIPDEDAEQFKTIGDIVKFVESKIS